MVLSEYPYDWLRFRCDTSGRWGQDWRERLIERYGAGTPLRDMLVTDCQRSAQRCDSQLPDLETAGGTKRC